VASGSCRFSADTGSFIPQQPTSFDDDSTRRSINFLRHSTDQTVSSGAGILNLLGIDYSLRPRLSTRLTLGGRTFPRNPWDFGEPDFNRLYRYLCLHSHSHALQSRLPLPLRCTWDAFLLRTLRCTHSFGIWLKSRSFSAQFRSMGQLLRTV
jgi:hypothetical protein